MTYPVTGHMIVKNEDKFVWFAIQSVLPYLERLIIYDTGSLDRTVEIIKAIKSPKIDFRIRKQDTPEELVGLRRDQIIRTKTDFFLLVDGDEIWPAKNIQKLLDCTTTMAKEKLAVFCRTRNAVGDVWHYLPQDAGHYHLGGMTGHFNIRLFRKTADLNVTGNYPLEAYTYSNKPIDKLDQNLVFLDVWYLHTTHLVRSSKNQMTVAGPSRQSKIKHELGHKFLQSELPEVFFLARPENVPDPLTKQSVVSRLRAVLETPIRRWKRKIA